MKKLVASFGMVALGVSAVQTVSAQSITSPDPAKPWSISATLRGFYDDNFNTVPDGFNLGSYSRDSYGYEIAPSARLNLSQGQSSLALGYTYSYKYYEESSPFDSDKFSQSHEFNLALDHAFSPRYRVSVRDGFVIGQEPDQLRAGSSFPTFQRISGDNIRNYGIINFGADVTRNLGFEIGYANTYFNYDDSQNVDDPSAGVAVPSLSGLLDRLKHDIHLDGRWTIDPTTVGILGYQFSDTEYTGDEALAYSGGMAIMSEDRNNRSHYVYVGADHSFRPDLSASLRAGARYNDYYNTDETGVSPFVRASVRWSYTPQSFVQGGINYDRTASDVVGSDSSGNFVRDQDAFTIFASINHQILPKLMGSVTGQFQNSTFNGGTVDNENEQIYLAGLNLEYQFNRHFSAHVGYNYDLLNSDIPNRGFDRNRVYLGVTAAY